MGVSYKRVNVWKIGELLKVPGSDWRVGSGTMLFQHYSPFSVQ
jgi:hypothetical protein